MSDQIHQAVSNDGTRIAGRVSGRGPPLVLAHGGADDGEFSWGAMLPMLEQRFTCYVPSMRGRGLSDDSDDHRPERHVEDLAAFVESIEGPVRLAGYSTGGVSALGAVESGADVSALALYESPVFEYFLEGEMGRQYQAAVQAAAEAAEEGRLGAAARAFLGESGFCNRREMAALDKAGAFEEIGQHVPVLLRVMEQAPLSEAPSPNDPDQLSRVTVPVLLARGSDTTPGHARSITRLAEELPEGEVREIPGAGHLAPAVEPEPIAQEFIRFFEARA